MSGYCADLCIEARADSVFVAQCRGSYRYQLFDIVDIPAEIGYHIVASDGKCLVPSDCESKSELTTGDCESVQAAWVFTSLGLENYGCYNVEDPETTGAGKAISIETCDDGDEVLAAGEVVAFFTHLYFIDSCATDLPFSP